MSFGITLMVALALALALRAWDDVALWWARSRGRRRGGFIWTWPAGRFWPLDPRPGDYDVWAVARGLASEARYSGQTRHFYSVAEHSVLVSRYAAALAVARGCAPRVVLEAAVLGLLHDLSEAYVGDVVRPIKYGRTFRGYRRVEARVQSVGELDLGGEFGAEARALVHEVDRRILVDEGRSLIAAPGVAEDFEKWGPSLGADLMFWAPTQAERAFLQRWDELAEARNILRSAA